MTVSKVTIKNWHHDEYYGRKDLINLQTNSYFLVIKITL